jgi:hypothetical protein
MMAHWIFTSRHHRAKYFESLATQLSAKYNNFVAASSSGKCKRALIARRSLNSSASIAFVVKAMRRTFSGKAKNGATTARRRGQICAKTSCTPRQTTRRRNAGADTC